MNLLGLPADLVRAIARAAEDVHTLARVATQVPDKIDRLDRRAEQVLDQIDRVIALAESLDASAKAMLSLGEQISTQGDVIATRAKEVAERGGELVSALPTLEQAVSLAQPLEGAVARLGRAVDRLPGGRAATTATPRKPPAKKTAKPKKA